MPLSLPGRFALGAALLAAAACAAPQARLEAHLASRDAAVRDCAAWYRALDERVDAAGVRDTLTARIPGFPYLRLDPRLAAARERARQGGEALQAFVERALELDLEARRHELAALPRGTLAADDALRRTRYCGRRLREADLASPEAAAALLDAAVLPAAKACVARRVEAPAGGARVRYAPPAQTPVSRGAVRRILARAAADPLGLVELSPGEVLLLAAAYAPSLEVTINGDGDRFGRVRWRAGLPAPEVDATEPSLYVRASAARYGERLLLQLAYTAWFPRRPLLWRVTLAPDGEPLLYDWLDAAGCAQGFVATPRARPRAVAAAQRLPRVAEDERPLVVVASGSHAVVRVELVSGSDSLVRYVLRPQEALRSIERVDGTRRPVPGQPPLGDPGEVAQRFVLDLGEPRS